MIHQPLPEFFERDILKLKEEISRYPDESSLWVVRGEISNSAGNLCLHLTGNLNHFIGALLGNSGYIRYRDLEFSLKDVPRADLIRGLEETVVVVNNTLQELSEADLQRNFPVEKHGQTVTTGYMLLHLLTHLNYHLGQVNYHRRLVSKV